MNARGLRNPRRISDSPGGARPLGLNPDEVSDFMDLSRAGLIVPETPCDKGMQDNFALRPETTVALTS